MSARRLKRAFSESDAGLDPAAEDYGTKIAQAFVAGRLGDVHAMCTPTFQERNPRDRFVDRWRQTIDERRGLTGFEVSNAGHIDLQYIPGLEDVPQSQFAAFVEIVFSAPDVPLDHEAAFAVGVVVLDVDRQLRIGAIHAR